MHTQIIVGAARADVSFVKASTTAKDAKYETRRVGDEARPATHPEADPTAIEDPFGPEESLAESLAEYVEEAGPISMPFATSPVQRGVTQEDGSWVDLTDELERIDDRTRIEGVAIDATVALTSIPRMWVRESYYIVPSGPDAVNFLGHLWWGLRETHAGAIVRWTKKTAQYLGAIVPIGTRSLPALVLLELEWAATRKETPTMARLDLRLVPLEGKAKAIEAMRAMLRPASVIDALRDERAAQRAELLAAARAGTVMESPKPRPTPPAAYDLGKALVAATK